MSYRARQGGCQSYRPRPKEPICIPGYSIELANFNEDSATVIPPEVELPVSFPTAVTHLPSEEDPAAWVESDGPLTGIRVQKSGLYQLNTSLLVEVSDLRENASSSAVTEVVIVPSINGAPLGANRPYRIRQDFRTRVHGSDTTFVQTLNGSVTVRLNRGDRIGLLVGSRVEDLQIVLTYTSQLLSIGRLSEAGRTTVFTSE